MKINCKWLPKENELDINDYQNEMRKAYDIFYNDFITSKPKINGFEVMVRRYPEDETNHRYSSFNHITTKDYDKIQGNSSNYCDRYPDIKRIERIAWVRKIIEHYDCKPIQNCNCRGVMTWYEQYRSTYRMNIMLYDENFLIVLEKNKNGFYFLITAFYFDNVMERKKRYEKYKMSTFVPNELKSMVNNA